MPLVINLAEIHCLVGTGPVVDIAAYIYGVYNDMYLNFRLTELRMIHEYGGPTMHGEIVIEDLDNKKTGYLNMGISGPTTVFLTFNAGRSTHFKKKSLHLDLNDPDSKNQLKDLFKNIGYAVFHR